MTDPASHPTPSPPYALLLLSAGAGLMIGLILAIPPWPQVVEHGPVEPGEMREQEWEQEQGIRLEREEQSE